MAGAPGSDLSRKSDTWGSRFGFIMAAVGSSVGLGNFWRFPFTAGENGGGAFILIYLLCVAAIGLPVLMGEYALGRKAGMSSVEGIQSLARHAGKSENWGIIGWVGVFCSTLIVTFYLVISVWILAFVIQAIAGFLPFTEGGFLGFTKESSGANFGATINNVGYIMFLLAIYVGLNAYVVGRGVKGGLEKAAGILMPAFFVMLIGVLVFSLLTGDVIKTVGFILQPDFSKVGFGTFLAALGQACFSLGVGSVLMMTYGSYLTRDTNIPKSSFIVAGSDTFVALIAGFAIFPIVFQAGLSPDAGPSLFFVSLPVAFGAIPGGDILATVFFALALFAAFTSSISLFEVSVAWLEERHGVSRMGAAMGVGFLLWVVGCAYIYSTQYIDFVNFLTGNVMLPLGALFIAIFIGWILPSRLLADEIEHAGLFSVWFALLKWFAPIFVGIILVFGFFDGLQNDFGVQLPGFLEMLLGPNRPV